MTNNKNGPKNINLTAASKVTSRAKVAELLASGATFNEPATKWLKVKGFWPQMRLSCAQREHISKMTKSFFGWYSFKYAIVFIWKNICAMFPVWLRNEAVRFAGIMIPYQHKSLQF